MNKLKFISSKGKDEKGYALMLSLIIMTLLGLLGAAFMMTATTEVQMTAFERKSLRAFYLAEGAVQRVIWEFKYGESTQGDPNMGDLYERLNFGLDGFPADTSLAINTFPVIVVTKGDTVDIITDTYPGISSENQTKINNIVAGTYTPLSNESVTWLKNQTKEFSNGFEDFTLTPGHDASCIPGGASTGSVCKPVVFDIDLDGVLDVLIAMQDASIHRYIYAQCQGKWRFLEVCKRYAVNL